MITERAPEAVRLRSILGLILAGDRHPLARLIGRSGLSRQLLLGLLRSMGPDVRWDGDTVWFAGDPSEYESLIAAEPTRSSHVDDSFPTIVVERMRKVLARVPPPIRGLDHVPATASTVLRRAQYIADKFDLYQTRLLFIGDHDCTSLAFGVLGLVARSMTVVDIDERLLTFLTDQPEAASGSLTPLFADLRLGLPEAAKAAHDVAFTDPPYTADGVGLFAARAVEGLAEPSKGRILLAYGFSESTPGLGLKVQRTLADLDLLFEAIHPDFNHYDGAQAIGSCASLYQLRPTKRTDRITVRTVARYGKTLYTHGSQSEESAAPASTRSGVPDALARAVFDQFGDDRAPLLVGTGWTKSNTVAVERFLSADRPTRRAKTTIIDLRPLFGWSLIRAALTATSDRTVIIAPKDAYGLYSAAESAQLCAALAPHYQVQDIQRTAHGSDNVLVVLERATTESVATNVWRRPHSRVATTWRESLIAAARQNGRELTKNQARALIEHSDIPATVTHHRLIDLPTATLARLHHAVEKTAHLSI